MNAPSQLHKRRRPSSPHMALHPLRVLRIVCASIVFILFLLAFTDIYQLFPDSWGRNLASFQLIPALNGALSGILIPAGIILAFLLVATLVLGRVYCSFLCPLGIFQDLLIRLSKLFRTQKSPKRFFRYEPPVRWVRGIILALVILSMITGVGSLIMWLDPYSQFGRMISLIVRPLIVEGNNMIVDWNDSLYTIPSRWVVLGWATIPAVILLVSICVLAISRGRLYCNTICPVGTFLGLLSRFSLFKLEIDKSACVKCAACMKSCKSQCIDLKHSIIDHSRCINCFDCVSVCQEHGIRYRFAWKKKDPEFHQSNKPSKNTQQPAPKGQQTDALSSRQATPSQTQVHVDHLLPSFSRRTFMGVTLTGLTASITPPGQTTTSSSYSKYAISPPGSQSIDHFISRCTACHLCLEACPTQCLRPSYLDYGWSHIFKPHLDFSEGFCNFDCNACSMACPAGAIQPIDLAEKKHTRIARAVFDQTSCIAARDKTDCGACSEHCPTKALDMVKLQQPIWDPDSCTNCGECAPACPVKAISYIPTNSGDQFRVEIDTKKCIGCADCVNTCSVSALHMEDSKWDIRVPQLSATYCIGCGACEFACPEKAVRVEGIAVHEQAEVLIQQQVEDPNAGKDFAF